MGLRDHVFSILRILRPAWRCVKKLFCFCYGVPVLAFANGIMVSALGVQSGSFELCAVSPGKRGQGEKRD